MTRLRAGRFSRRSMAVTVMAGVVLAGAGPFEPASGQSESSSSLAVSPGEAGIGDRLIVRLEGWASAAVTLTLCGNLGLRGAPDCDVTAGVGIGLSRSGPTLAELKVAVPPAACPCVVRASSSTGSEVRTAPVEIVGVPTGPLLRPGPPPPLLTLKAEVSKVPERHWGTVRTLLGGRIQHRVTISLHNTSTVTLSKVSLRLAVGRSADSGLPVAMPAVASLQPGETRNYDVPATITAPTWGRYLWQVRADGAGPRVVAQAGSAARPWLLYVLAVLLFLDAVVIGTLRLCRRRRRRVSAPTGR